LRLGHQSVIYHHLHPAAALRSKTIVDGFPLTKGHAGVNSLCIVVARVAAVSCLKDLITW